MMVSTFEQITNEIEHDIYSLTSMVTEDRVWEKIYDIIINPVCSVALDNVWLNIRDQEKIIED